MQKLAAFITGKYKMVLIFCLILAFFSAILTPLVKTNFNLVEYLPKDADSTKAINLLKDEFGSGIPNADFYMPDIDLSEAITLKKKIQEVSGVEAVFWLDDVWDMSKPLTFADPKLIETFYQDNGARYIITASTEDSLKTVDELEALAGDDGAVSGELINLASSQRGSKEEILQIFWLIIPTAMIILSLATSSFIEPWLLLLCVLFAVLLNMGTNIFFKDISFLTNSVAPILQMAVSMDYAIFLLHKYEEYRALGKNDAEALIMAVPKASVAVLSSSLTTLFGFLALLFMRFRIGADMGIVLAKGILFSLLSVIIFLPALVMLTGKYINKFRHRNFLPAFTGIAKFIVKSRLIIMVVVVIMVIPSYMAQANLNFRYGMDGLKEGSKAARDKAVIMEKFGQEKQLAIIVPRGNLTREIKLEEDLLRNIPEIKAVISYNNQVDKAIPQDFLPAGQISQLVSKNYSRLILTCAIANEGKETFQVMQKIKHELDENFPDTGLIAGEAASMFDMKNTVNSDTMIVNGLAIMAIGLVLFLAFKSFTIPFILLLTIEASIWINLAVPYFADIKLSFIGYLVISTVQLGATVDYGILLMQNYIDLRRKLSKRESVVECIKLTIPSLLPPVLILTAAGLFLSIISSMDVVRELGVVLARGAVLSLINVLAFLPGFLYCFDKLALKAFIGKRYKGEFKF